MYWIASTCLAVYTFFILFQWKTGTVYRLHKQFPHEWRQPKIFRSKNPKTFWYAIVGQSAICAYLWYCVSQMNSY